MLHGDNPAVDEVTQAHGNGSHATTTVEFLAVNSPTSIVDGHDAALPRLCTGRNRLASIPYNICHGEEL